MPGVRTAPHPRMLEATLLDRLQRSPVVVVTGARQTGTARTVAVPLGSVL
jgi:hypothetical protein